LQVKTSSQQAIEFLKQQWLQDGGLELISGGPSSAAAQSQWGHTSMRFVGSGASALEDIVVEAMALSPPTDKSSDVIINGVSGNYAIVLHFGSLGNLIQSYYFSETRGYSRTIIPSTRELRQSLLNTLSEVNQVRIGKDRYYFFTNNCTSYLAWLLETTGFNQVSPPTPFLPARVNLHLRRSFISPWPEVEGISSKDLHRYSNLQQNHSWEKVSTLDLQRLIAFRARDLGANRSRIISQLKSRQDFKSTEQVYGVEILPKPFYQQGEKISEAISPASLATYFTSAQLSQAALYNRAAWMTNYTSTFCSNLKSPSQNQCNYFAKAKKLIETAGY